MSQHDNIPQLSTKALQRLTAKAMAHSQAQGAEDVIPTLSTDTLGTITAKAMAQPQVTTQTEVPELTDPVMNSMIAHAMAQPQVGAVSAKTGKMAQTSAKIVAFPKQNWRKSVAAGGFAVAASVMLMLTLAQPTVNADTLNEIDEMLFFETVEELL